MILSDLASPAEASIHHHGPCPGFAQAGNRYPPRIKCGAGFFGIMLVQQGSEIMHPRPTLATLLMAAMISPAVAQSASSTNFQTRPMQSAPASSNGQRVDPKIPPAARSGGGGIRVGPGTNEKDDGITVKRIK